MFRKFVMMLGVIAVGIGFAGSASAATVLKVGTLAPSNSPWAKGFKQWANDISTETNGELQLDFQWNGQAGDEVLMVQKIRSGQLDAAAITAIGLGQTGVTDVLIFQLPGLFTSWAKLDGAREATKDELSKQFEAKGFTILGWGDVGAAKTMSVGFEVHKPSDLQGKNVLSIAGDPVQPKIYSSIGGITFKPLSVMEILPSLTNGSINVLTVPPLAAEQLQWASRITHMSTQTIAFAIGATVISTARIQSLPPNLRDVLLKRSKEMSDKLGGSIRNMDAQAYARMKATKVTYDPAEADVQAWRDVFLKVGQQLRGTVFTPALLDKIVKLADNPLVPKY
jgi:TRAP-type transport system periplasmic protein